LEEQRADDAHRRCGCRLGHRAERDVAGKRVGVGIVVVQKRDFGDRVVELTPKKTELLAPTGSDDSSVCPL
jgi:hypothetical protein